MLTREENARISIAMAIDIEFTRAHFHRNFEEIYIVLDGWIKLQLYDPGMEKFSECTLLADELLVIAPGVHHKISSASEKKSYFDNLSSRL
jgi:mannose-6-phosphate isomerase-like protein (cupin superfamily)